MEDFDISGLRPEDVRDRPAWWRSPWRGWPFAGGLWAALVVLILVREAQFARQGITLPSPWLWALVVPGLSAGGIFSRHRARRWQPRETELALKLVLRRRPRRARRHGVRLVRASPEMWAATVISLIFITVHALPHTMFWAAHVVEAALVGGFVIGMNPAYFFGGRRIWRRAEEIIREVKAGTNKGGAG